MTRQFQKIDLHMHSTISDGTDTPEEILCRVREAGIDLFSLTDHDAIKGAEAICDVRKEGDPRFITGVEFSCRDENGKYHILGYGYDPKGQSIQRTVGLTHKLRMEKVVKRLDFLKEEFRVVFPEEEIKALLSLDNPGKPHIGNLMVKYGYAPSKEVAIKEFIDRLRMAADYNRPEEAIDAIVNSGGIPVLAHPFYGSGDELILGEEMEDRLTYLMHRGLQGVEAYYSGFTAKLTGQMLEMADRYHLYVTAGSDYHGVNKLVVLGDTGMTEGQEIPEGMRLFLERAVR